MKAFTIFSAVLVLVAAACLLPSAPRVVSAGETAYDTGGVWLDNFRCMAVATCDQFNQFAGSVRPCPNVPANTCAFCTNGDRTLVNCVRSTGSVCKWQPPGNSNCGVLQVGGCVGAECIMSFSTGVYCIPGTGCR